MTEAQRQHVLAGGQLTPDRVRDAWWRCCECGTEWPIPKLARDCEARCRRGMG